MRSFCSGEIRAHTEAVRNRACSCASSSVPRVSPDSTEDTEDSEDIEDAEDSEEASWATASPAWRAMVSAVAG